MASRRGKLRMIKVVIVLGSFFLAVTGRGIAQACYNTTPKDPVVIYEGSLNTSWTMAGSLNSATIEQTAPGGQYGRYALRTDFNAANSILELRLTGVLVDTTTHGYLSFRIRKEDADGGISVTGHRADGTMGTFPSLSSYLVYGQSTLFMPSQWYSVRVPLADMGITSGTLLQGVAFKSNTPTTIYLDEVVLIDGISVAFPLQYQGWTPYTATIASVFDHTMTATYTHDTDHIVTAWTGEKGDGPPAINDATCRQQANGLPFTLQTTGSFIGTYQGGGGNCGGNTYLSYDGHAGIDYAVPDSPTPTPVYAAQEGVIIAGGILSDGTLVEDCPVDGSSCVGIGDGWGRMRIKHANGYTTWYMHLSRQAGGLAIGTHVTQGQLIGYSGHTAPIAIGPHLHFEIRIGSGFADSPIDPYGWDGVYADPYHSYHQHVFNSRQWQ